MKYNCLFYLLICCHFLSAKQHDILFYEVDLNDQSLSFFLEDDNGDKFNSFKRLNTFLEHKGKCLKFAMNGGMYLKDRSPQGLYIENSIQIKKLDTLSKAYGNFYMQPNGVFYIDEQNQPGVCETPSYNGVKAKYATQSGPMLVINGAIHHKFRLGSKNLNIRNGVGVLPNGNLIFAMSKAEINLYDFALFFKNKGCKNALYLDGFVSRTYLPSKGYTDLNQGNFGVIIGVYE